MYLRYFPSKCGAMRRTETVQAVRGLPYMTSTVGGGGGSPKSRQKDQNQLISVHDREGGGVKRIS